VSVDRAEVARLARLAQLELDEGEMSRLAVEMSRILEHAELLIGAGLTDEHDGDAELGEEPSPRENTASGVRDPALTEADPLRDGPAAFAPDFRDGFFAVPAPPGVSTEAE
jgi:Asp-tRNA(Asn)/Glu-tRNA(Gln) amidotransferase C subunit